MDNQFIIETNKLPENVLNKKRQLENEPSSRINYMEYLPDMQQINSDIRTKVLNQSQNYNYLSYTTKNVKAALEHETCTVEDFKALLSPAAEPYLEKMAQRASLETAKHFGNTVYLFTPLYIANYCENYCV